MKTNIEIRDDVYAYLKSSKLSAEITGKLYTTQRPEHSDLEDVVISVLANSLGDKQEAFLNINVYVKDVVCDGLNVENSKRLRVLSRIALECLSSVSNDYRLTLSEQTTMSIDSIGYHVINNRVLYQYVE